MQAVAWQAFLTSGEHTIYQSDRLVRCQPRPEPATVQAGAKYSLWRDSSLCAGRLQVLRSILALTDFTA